LVILELEISMHKTLAVLCVLAISGAVGATSPASAQNRPSTTAMSCQQAQAMVNTAGAAVLGTGGFSYDRFVRSEAMCTREEMGIPAWAPTLDVAQCFIGYVCESRAGRDATPN
jgi:hypothetical protein